MPVWDFKKDNSNRSLRKNLNSVLEIIDKTTKFCERRTQVRTLPMAAKADQINKHRITIPQT